MNNLVYLIFCIVKDETLEKFLRERQLSQRVNYVWLCQLVPNSSQQRLCDIAQPPALQGWGAVLPQSCQESVMSSFWIFADVIGEEQYLNIVLICISFLLKEVGHLFMCKGQLCILFVNCLFLTLTHFSIKFLSFFSLHFFIKLYLAMQYYIIQYYISFRCTTQ